LPTTSWFSCRTDTDGGEADPDPHSTLGALRDAGLGLHAFCLNKACHWHADLDVNDLIERLGRRQSAQPPDLVPLLVCSQRGGKQIAVVLKVGDHEVPDDAASDLKRRWPQKY
jgi:hypothetical protein